MRLIRSIVAISVLLSADKCWGQSPIANIAGYVVNVQSEPLEGAIIRMPSTDKHAISSDNGFFRIPDVGEGSITLTVSALGYYDTVFPVTVLPGENHITIRCTENPIVLNPITVTAEKKQTNLQHTPLAVSVLNAKKVRDYRIWALEDIGVVAPNFHTSMISDVPQLSIRGIAPNGGGSFDPPYAIYIDGVMQYDMNSMITHLYDIERIEVLRGPQGTLYGRNATAGVIHIITSQPGNETTGHAEVSFGNRGLQRHTVGVKTPVVKDKLFVGISGYYHKTHGFVTNAYDNSDFDRNSGYGGNFHLRYLPRDDWRMTLNIKNQFTASRGVFPYISYNDSEAIRNYRTNQDATGDQRRNFLNASLSVENENTLFVVNSITSYQYSDRMIYDGAWDFDWTADDLSRSMYLGNPSDNASRAVMQELRLTNPSKKGRLKWIAGGFYSRYDRNEDGMLWIGEKVAAMGDPYAPYGLRTPLDIRNTSFALFGQVSFALTTKLKLTGGIRYDWETKKQTTQTDMVKVGMPTTALIKRKTMQDDYKAVSPKLNIAYDVSPEIMTFLNYARGFRAGGLNTRIRSADYFTYGPEFTSNFEWGIRTSWFDNRLVANCNAFYIYWNDMQVTVFIPGGAGNYALQNTGRAKIKGLELEISAMPLKGLTIDGNFGYTHGRYAQLAVPDIATGTKTNAKGHVLINQPVTTSMLAAQYSRAVSGMLNAFVRGEWIHTGTQYFDLLNTIKQHPYSLINTRVGISSRHIDITLWARNLLDSHYLAGIYASGSPLAIPASPVSYGITVTSRF